MKFIRIGHGTVCSMGREKELEFVGGPLGRDAEGRGAIQGIAGEKKRREEERVCMGRV